MLLANNLVLISAIVLASVLLITGIVILILKNYKKQKDKTNKK